MANVGARAKRADDPRLLTGRGRYVGDIALPRMTHVAIVRSPHAHARILHVDVEDAQRASGVVAVLVGRDVAALCTPYRGILRHYAGMKTGAMLPLALDRVRFVGEPVVALAAESPEQAIDAAERVRVEYEPLAALLTPEQAVAPGAPSLHDDLADNIVYETRLSTGDVEAALREALAQKERLVFLDFITDQTENVFPMVPGGKGLTEMILAEEL